MIAKSCFSSLRAEFCAKEQWTPRQVFGPGRRPHFLLYVVLEGKGILQLRNEIYHLQPGEVFFLTPDTDYYLEADEYTPWQITWAAFSGEEAGRELAAARFSSSPVWSIPGEQERLFQYSLHLVDVFKREHSRPLEIEGALLQLISFLLPRPKVRRSETRETYLNRAKAYIDSNYCYDIRIQDIARQLGIDRSYIYRLFMELEHMAPTDYLLSRRLEHARSVLESGGSPAAAAYSCGFADPESLQYHFQNSCGMTPEEYRWSCMKEH